MRSTRILACWLVCSCIWVAARLQGAPTNSFELHSGDRVLFIGDTFFEREVDSGAIETALTAHWSGENVTFRNLAWAADSPLGQSRASFDWNRGEDFWLGRVKEQLSLVKPTVAFLSYGTSAALGGAGAAPKFGADLRRLMTAINEASGTNVRFVLLGPIGVPGAGGTEPQRFRDALTAIEATTREVAAESGSRCIPLSGAWMDSSRPERTHDGIHLTPEGYEMVAGKILDGLVGPSERPKALGNVENYRLLQQAIQKKNELFFNRWRPENWTYLFGFRKHEQGQNAVEIPQFEPLIAEWEARIARLRDIAHPDAAVIADVKRLLERKPSTPTAPISQPQPVPTFEVADGFEVSLWAENPQLHKPIGMNWDPQGRLWIASSEVYPQIKPGQPATDSVVVLEDTRGSGKADKATVFADGLLIPTGVLPDGTGGCYVAASSQLLHFGDKDHDGKADQREVVLSSFGTEDTHHNLHTLRWGYDGRLYMNQSIYTHSHIETPQGVVRLNSGGIWRFNPETWKLEVFCKGGCNPWGHHWDQWGNHFFTDGAGFKGVYHAMEGATYFTYSDMRREAESISPGNYPKFASLEVVHSPNFPNDWQGSVITCDFRAHRVVRFSLSDVGSSFQTHEMPDLLRSTNVTFRPIDVRFGPDGALYIADWSNPIIQHGEVDFRDPRRDKEHGRIWRVAAKGRPLADAMGMRKTARESKTEALLPLLLSPNAFHQASARRLLALKGVEVLPAADTWVKKQTDPRARLEIVWLHEAVGRPLPSLITELAASTDDRLRTAAARQLTH